MFTLQSKLIENAAAAGDSGALTKSLANCAAPLQHRGPVAITPSHGFSPPRDVPPENGGDIVFFDGPTINIPPWQNVPFYPTPLVDAPPFFPFDYSPPWGDGESNPFPEDEPTLRADGPTRLGDVVANTITTVDQTFYGDIIYQGERLSFVRTNIITNVYWDATANALKVSKASALVVANLGRTVTASAIEGVECAPGLAPNDVIEAP